MLVSPREGKDLISLVSTVYDMCLQKCLSEHLKILSQYNYYMALCRILFLSPQHYEALSKCTTVSTLFQVFDELAY